VVALEAMAMVEIKPRIILMALLLIRDIIQLIIEIVITLVADIG
jgi:hypothetical protein